MQQEYDHLVKIILVGNSGVGKTSSLARYCDNTFTPYYTNTIGVDFKIKTIVSEGKTLKLQIWDTAGAERFRTITAAYYRGAAGIIIVFDITNIDSFKMVDKWAAEVTKNANPNVSKILLGNKCDLLQNRAVSYEEAYTKAKENGMPYFEGSAKTGENIAPVFESVCTECLHNPLLHQITLKKDAKKKETVKISNGFFDKLKPYCG